MKGIIPNIIGPPREYSFIGSVEITKLFGFDDVTIDFSSSQDDIHRQINILYGENGEGKTTILRLIYSILSSQDQKGLKNWVLRTPFDNCRIGMTNGDWIEVSRNASGDIGLRISAYHANETHTFWLPADEKGVIGSRVKGNQVAQYLAFLSKFSPKLFYITDDRKYFTNSTIVQNSLERFKSRRTVYPDIDEDGNLVSYPGTTDEDGDIVDISAMSLLISDVFRDEIVQSGVFAQQSANQIYRDLIVRIAGDARLPSAGGGSREELINRIIETETQISPAQGIGVIPGIDKDLYISVVTGASKSALNRLKLVLEPYLESMRARADAVGIYVDRMRSFLSELNHFYRRKEFRFDLSDGFSVVSTQNAMPMNLEWLSSGERQLFIILSSVFLTQSSSAIVLIDEPELSLNVLWQREFVSSLQRISQYSPVQYVLASHSLEILSSGAGVVRSLGTHD